MKKTDETPEGLGGNDRPKKKRVFQNFAEYWHYIRVLSDEQKEVIAKSLTRGERQALKQSFQRGGWQDLFMRNACDFTLDRLRDQYGIDLIELRMKVLSGKPQLIQRTFWEYVHQCFEQVPEDHRAYIFDGIGVIEYDAEYVKLYSVTEYE